MSTDYELCYSLTSINDALCSSRDYHGYSCRTILRSNHTVDTVVKDFSYTKSSEATCVNETFRSFCPPGFYCPTQYEILPCERGNYCHSGSEDMTPCLLGQLTCPEDMMSKINGSTGVAVLTVIVVICLITYRYFANKLIFWSEVRYAVEKSNQARAASVQSASLHELKDEHKYARALKFLNKRRGENVEEKKRATIVPFNTGATIASRIMDTDDDELAEDNSLASRATFDTAASSDARPSPSSRLRRIVRSDRFKELVASIRAQKETFRTESHGTFAFQAVAEPLTISFEKLNLNLKSSNAPILQNVFGTFRPFNITALMGSSGAGKTTLLSLLRGQAHFASTSGNIFVNGSKVESLVPFRDRMAFVPQDDIVYDELSVKDNILYSAMLFNKRGYRTEEECYPMVIYAMDLLGLSAIAHSVVGSAEKKGISGGQKKRVSVAQELVKEPDIFLLDEPTSGLDAATSVSLLHSLHNISANGVNIVATLHQPRREILDMINSICLLVPGGRVIFFGPPYMLDVRFRQLGYQVPQGEVNMADFAMDAIAGFIKPKWDRKSLSRVTNAELTRRMYELYDASDYPEFKKQLDSLLKQYRENADAFMRESVLMDNKSLGSREERPRFSQFAIVDALIDRLYTRHMVTLSVAFRRQVKNTHRTFEVVIYGGLIFIVMGLLIANVNGAISLDPTFSGTGYASQIISAQVTFALIIVNAALRLFMFDSTVRLREEMGGLLLTPYFVGKIMGSCVDFVVYPFTFLCGYYPMVQSQASFADYWAVYLLLHLAVSAQVNLLAILVPGKQTSLLCSGFIIILWSCGGISPPTSDLIEKLGVIGRILNAVSPFSASFRLQLFLEMESYSPAWDNYIDTIYDLFSFKLTERQSAYAILIAHWVIGNFLAYVALILKRDNGKIVRDAIDRLQLQGVVDAARSLRSKLTLSLASVDDNLNTRIKRALDRRKQSNRGAGASVSTVNKFDAVFPIYDIRSIFESEKPGSNTLNPLQRQKTKAASAIVELSAIYKV